MNLYWTEDTWLWTETSGVLARLHSQRPPQASASLWLRVEAERNTPLVSPILKNKGNLGYFLILLSQLINTWFALKCKNITLHTLLIIKKSTALKSPCFSATTHDRCLPEQNSGGIFSRAFWLRAVTTAPLTGSAISGAAAPYLSHIFLLASSLPPQTRPLKTHIHFTSVSL